MRRRLSALLVAAVIVCGVSPASSRIVAEGRYHPFNGDFLPRIGSRQNTGFAKSFTRYEGAKLSAAFGVKGVSVNHLTIGKEAFRARPDPINFFSRECIYRSEASASRVIGKQGKGGWLLNWRTMEVPGIKRQREIKDRDVTIVHNIVRGRDALVPYQQINLWSLPGVEFFKGTGPGRDIGSQLPSRSGTSFPQRPDKKARAASAQKEGPESKSSGVVSGISRLPLGAKVGVALVSSILAARILFSGFVESGDSGSYRTRGFLKFALGCLLLLFLTLFWWVGSPY